MHLTIILFCYTMSQAHSGKRIWQKFLIRLKSFFQCSSQINIDKSNSTVLHEFMYKAVLYDIRFTFTLLLLAHNIMGSEGKMRATWMCVTICSWYILNWNNIYCNISACTAYMRFCSGSSLVWILICCLFGTNTLPKPLTHKSYTVVYTPMKICYHNCICNLSSTDLSSICPVGDELSE